MGAGMGGLSALVISKILTKTWDIESAMNGSLAGLVSITSGSPSYEPWAALIIGSKRLRLSLSLVSVLFPCVSYHSLTLSFRSLSV
jgi:ammonia channel protein AmtB